MTFDNILAITAELREWSVFISKYLHKEECLITLYQYVRYVNEVQFNKIYNSNNPIWQPFVN